MTQKPKDNFHIVLTILCVVSAVAFTAIFYSYQISNLQDQISSLEGARLVNVSLTSSDDGHGVIHVSGYVCNAGNLTAYGSNVEVRLFRDSTAINSTRIFFGENSSDELIGARVAGRNSVYVDENVAYTGTAPSKVTLTLGWNQAWQLPIP